MLIVETYLDSSQIAGLGLFSAKSIKKGELIEFVDDRFYKKFHVNEVKLMPTFQKEFFKTHSFIHEGYHYLPLDNGRFMNHSEKPNTKYKDLSWYADEDIAPGNEITCNYKEFAEEGIDWE